MDIIVDACVQIRSFLSQGRSRHALGIGVFSSLLVALAATIIWVTWERATTEFLYRLGSATTRRAVKEMSLIIYDNTRRLAEETTFLSQSDLLQSQLKSEVLGGPQLDDLIFAFLTNRDNMTLGFMFVNSLGNLYAGFGFGDGTVHIVRNDNSTRSASTGERCTIREEVNVLNGTRVLIQKVCPSSPTSLRQWLTLDDISSMNNNHDPAASSIFAQANTDPFLGSAVMIPYIVPIFDHQNGVPIAIVATEVQLGLQHLDENSLPGLEFGSRGKGFNFVLELATSRIIYSSNNLCNGRANLCTIRDTADDIQQYAAVAMKYPQEADVLHFNGTLDDLNGNLISSMRYSPANLSYADWLIVSVIPNDVTEVIGSRPMAGLVSILFLSILIVPIVVTKVFLITADRASSIGDSSSSSSKKNSMNRPRRRSVIEYTDNNANTSAAIIALQQDAEDRKTWMRAFGARGSITSLGISASLQSNLVSMAAPPPENLATLNTPQYIAERESVIKTHKTIEKMTFLLVLITFCLVGLSATAAFLVWRSATTEMLESGGGYHAATIVNVVRRQSAFYADRVSRSSVLADSLARSQSNGYSVANTHDVVSKVLYLVILSFVFVDEARLAFPWNSETVIQSVTVLKYGNVYTVRVANGTLTSGCSYTIQIDIHGNEVSFPSLVSCWPTLQMRNNPSSFDWEPSAASKIAVGSGDWLGFSTTQDRPGSNSLSYAYRSSRCPVQGGLCLSSVETPTQYVDLFLETLADSMLSVSSVSTIGIYVITDPGCIAAASDSVAVTPFQPHVGSCDVCGYSSQGLCLPMMRNIWSDTVLVTASAQFINSTPSFALPDLFSSSYYDPSLADNSSTGLYDNMDGSWPAAYRFDGDDATPIIAVAGFSSFPTMTSLHLKVMAIIGGWEFHQLFIVAAAQSAPMTVFCAFIISYLLRTVSFRSLENLTGKLQWRRLRRCSSVVSAGCPSEFMFASRPNHRGNHLHTHENDDSTDHEGDIELASITLPSVISANNGNKTYIAQLPTAIRAALAAEHHFIFKRCLLHLDDALNARPLRVIGAAGLALRCSHVYLARPYTYFINIVSIAYCSIAFWEYPSSSWQDDYWSAMSAEITCILLLLADWVLLALSRGWSHRNIPSRNQLFQFLIRFLFLVDWAIACTAGTDSRVLRFSRFLRPISAVMRARNTRAAFILLLKIMPSIKDLLFLLVSFVVCSSVFCIVAFSSQYSWGQISGFWNLWYSIAALTTLLTSENYPYIMVAAVDSTPGRQVISRIGLGFFIGFVLCSLFFFVPGIIATFFEAYKRHARKRLSRLHSLAVSSLAAAFDLLDRNCVGELSKEQFTSFMVAYHSRNGEVNEVDVQKKIEARFTAIDVNCSNSIDQVEFCALSSLLLQEMREWKTSFVEPSNPVRERVILCFFSHSDDETCNYTPRVWFNSAIKIQVVLMLFVNSLYGAVFLDAFRSSGGPFSEYLVANDDVVDGFNCVFMLLFLFELSVKMIALTPIAFWKSNIFNKCDIILALVFAIPSLIIIAAGGGGVFWARCFFALTTMRVFTVVHTTSHLMRLFFSIIPVFIDIMLLSVAFLYCMAIIGAETFADYQSPSQQVQNQIGINTDLIDSGVAGFGSVRSSFLTMFQLFIAQNYSDVMLPYSNKFGLGSMVYFGITVFVGNMLLSNLIIGMVVDAFAFKRAYRTAVTTEKRMWKKARELERRMDIKGNKNSVCWLCTTEIVEIQRPIVPFDDCQCLFHRYCVLSYEFRRGECPKCRMIGKFEEGNMRYDIEGASLDQQMYGHQVSKEVSHTSIIAKIEEALIANRAQAEFALRLHMLSLGFTCVIAERRMGHLTAKKYYLPPTMITFEALGQLLGGTVSHCEMKPLSSEPANWNLIDDNRGKILDVSQLELQLQSWCWYIICLREYEDVVIA